MASALIGTISQVQAGDFAYKSILGFSDDGKIFAFEEYGVEDGSGFPYSNIYMIDLSRNAWLSGTPLRTRLRLESATLKAARLAARLKAKPLLLRRDVGRQAREIYQAGLGQLKQQGGQTTVDVPNGVDPLGESAIQSFVFHLKSYVLGGGAECGIPLRGFTLSVLANGATQIPQKDERVAKSRGCATDYRISSVVVPEDRRGAAYGVVLVSVFSRSFEGFDRRFLAIPFSLN